MKAIAIWQREMEKMAVWAAALWIAAGLMAANTVRADIYTWQDTHGVIHYSNHDAPSHAELYMKVTAPPPSEVQSWEPPVQEQDTALETIRQERVRTEAKLEETHRKLDRALEKVVELTDQVSESQARAAAAAQAAGEAAAAAEIQAETAAQYQQKEVKERVIVYGVPYSHRYRKHGIGHQKPYYARYPNKSYRHHKPDRFRKQYPQFRDKYKRHPRHGRHPGQRNSRITPKRQGTPNAYWIRDRTRGARGSGIK